MNVRRQRIARRLAITSAALVGTALTPLPAFAQNGTWNGATADYNVGGNWTPAGVPTNQATLAATGQTTVAVTANSSINAVIFAGNAQTYSFINDAAFTVNGIGFNGFVNTSAQSQSVTNFRTMTFNNDAQVLGGAGGITLRNMSNAGSAPVLTFNNSSGLGANVNLLSGGSSISAVGNDQVGVGATVIFNNASFADGATLSFAGGVGGAQAAGANAASAIAGGSNATFNDGAHADNADITNEGGASIAFADLDPLGTATAIGGGATLSFNGTSHADGAQIENRGANTSAFAGGAAATSVGGSGTVILNDSSHIDGATVTNVAGVTGGTGGTGGAGTGLAGGTALTVGGSASFQFNDGSHADNSTFQNLGGGLMLVGGTGGAGDANSGGLGGSAVGSSGSAGIVFGGTSHANNSSFNNLAGDTSGTGGTGGAGGSTGVGGAGGAASAAGAGASIQFNNGTGVTGATFVNTAGSADAFGGTGGAGGNGAAGGQGGIGVAAGAGASIFFSGTASAGTGTTIANQGGDGNATGGAGGSGGSAAGGNGGQGGNATALGGTALVTFGDTASAGSATIVNTPGTALATGGNGGNGAVGAGGNGGNASATAGGAGVVFNNSATAANAVITNNSGTPIDANLGTPGTPGGGGGLGGSAAGASASAARAFVRFNDTSTGGAVRINNNSGLVELNDGAVFGTALGGGALIVNDFSGFTGFNDASSLGNGQIVNGGTSGGSTTFSDTSTAGSGTITNNAFSGTTFFDSSSAGSATINNLVNGVLTFVGTSSAGTATINNAGLTTFAADSDAVSGRMIQSAGGTLNMSAINGTLRLGSLSGNGTVLLGANILQLGYLDLNETFAGVISGAGGLIKRGTGTFVLTGANDYTGGTSILAGTLQIGNGGTTGSVDGNILNNSALIFNRSNSLVYDDVISGSGTLTKNGAGTLVFTGENTYTGLTTVNQGVLQIGLIGTTGSIVSDVVLNNDSRIAFSRTDNYSYAGSISGTGSMVKVGPGVLVFTGANTYTGGTTIAGGTLQIGNAGTTGSIAGDINVGTGSALAFNRTDTITFGGNIAGGGQLTKLAAGTLILTGDVTLTGNTIVSQGTLQIGNGGTTGSVGGNIINNAIVTFNRSNTLTYGGVMSGSGGLIQNGTGTLILTGANTHNGGTIVGAGTLQLNGSLASGVSIFANGRMTGTGTVNNAIVVAGTISPGTAATPLGTLTATGAVTFNAGSILAPTITSGGASSLLQAGSLTINAGTVRPTAQAGGLFLMQTDYRIAVGTGGRTGTFGGVDESQLASFLDASLVYTPTEVFLRVRRNATTFAQTAGLTPNQSAVSTSLDAAVAASNPLVFTTYLSTYNTLLGLQANGPLQGALNTLSGDALTAVPVAAQEHASRFAERLGTYTWSNSSNIWGLIAYGDQEADSDGNGPGFDADGLEFQMGFNTSLGANTRLGLSVGYNDADVTISERLASADIETWSVGAHLRHDFGPVYVSGQLTYSWHSIESSRALLLNGTATGDYDAQTWTAAGEIGWVARSGNLAIEPHLSIRHADTNQDAYNEAGPVGALNVAEADYQTTRFGVGIRLANRDPQAPIRFHALVRYEHETGDSRSVLDNTLPGLPTFTVFGTRLGDDILTADVGAEVRLSSGVSLFGSVGGHTRSNETSVNANAGLRISF